MGVRVLTGYLELGKKKEAAAVLYDSVTMTAFGPVMMMLDAKASLDELRELADEFADYVEQETGEDARMLEDEALHEAFVEFLKTKKGDDEEEDQEAGKEDAAS